MAKRRSAPRDDNTNSSTVYANSGFNGIVSGTEYSNTHGTIFKYRL